MVVTVCLMLQEMLLPAAVRQADHPLPAPVLQDTTGWITAGVCRMGQDQLPLRQRRLPLLHLPLLQPVSLLRLHHLLSLLRLQLLNQHQLLHLKPVWPCVGGYWPKLGLFQPNIIYFFHSLTQSLISQTPFEIF